MDEMVRVSVEATLKQKGENFNTLWLVWKCKTIQNYKYVFATNSGHMIEATYNGNLDELYVDIYKKDSKKVIQKYREVRSEY